ncbi:MAG: 4-phosphopantetheinyl transferase family protein [Chitinophagaceae bacterium]|nr:4-phosphopantetheinyl transferase family protein [Chitinophagaceae bacterium]
MPRGRISEMATLFWSVKECIFKWDSRGGVDFIRDIRIISFTGDASEGRVEVLFRGEGPLDVHYLHFNGNYLTWVITGS